MGVSTEGLRATPEGEKEPKQAERSEEQYVIESALKVLKVLEALEGRNFEPVGVKRVMQRTGFDRSFCRAALITLKKAGWAKQIISGKENLFYLGSKAENLARGLAASLMTGSSDPRQRGSAT